MINKNKQIELSIINESRTILLGIAALLIVLFHSGSLNFQELIGINIISNILTFIQRTGNIGVDIFLFLSGIGLYHSLSKNNLKQYYKNRFIRIIPTFYIVTLAFTLLTKAYNIKDFFETIFLVSFFIKGELDIWYIPFIIVLYLIFPIIYKVIKKYDTLGLFILLFILVMFNFLHLMIFPKSYGLLEIATTRIPIFITGAYFGKVIYEKEKISTKIIPISILIQIFIPIIINITIDSPNFTIFSRYLYYFLAISIVILISLIYTHIKNKNNIIFKIIKFIGNHSLEIYLIYELIKQIISESLKISSYTKFYILCFIITIIVSYILKVTINKIINLITKISKK